MHDRRRQQLFESIGALRRFQDRLKVCVWHSGTVEKFVKLQYTLSSSFHCMPLFALLFVSAQRMMDGRAARSRSDSWKKID